MLCQYDLVVTTYQTLGSDFTSDGEEAPCGKVEWGRVICDESHTLKNVKAKLTLACLALRGAHPPAAMATHSSPGATPSRPLFHLAGLHGPPALVVCRPPCTRRLSAPPVVRHGHSGGHGPCGSPRPVPIPQPVALAGRKLLQVVRFVPVVFAHAFMC